MLNIKGATQNTWPHMTLPNIILSFLMSESWAEEGAQLYSSASGETLEEVPLLLMSHSGRGLAVSYRFTWGNNTVEWAWTFSIQRTWGQDFFALLQMFSVQKETKWGKPTHRKVPHKHTLNIKKFKNRKEKKKREEHSGTYIQDLGSTVRTEI